MNNPTKVFLSEEEMPRQWYNIAADLEHPLPPPLNKEGEPVKPDDLAPVFPMNLIEQEMSTERWIDIPEPVLDILSLWRPSPLYRAKNFEGVSPAGSHKPNTSVAQAYYNKAFGIKRLTTETGAGQWGSALSMACSLLDLECKVYMVRVSFDQKPFRKLMMQTWGAECVASPSPETQFGKSVLENDPACPGSLGIAISEAIEDAVTSKDTRYSLGSVLNHVMLHQTVIGLEAKKQRKKVGAEPDIVIGCVGGGSNFAGLSFPFLYDKINGREMRVIAVEPYACPTLTRAPFSYDTGDTAMMTPLLAMYSLGHTFVPPPIHAGGLRYHGMAPLVSHVLREGLIEARALHQLECYKAATLWARTEGFISAPETSHAIACAMQEALRAKEEGREKTILLNWSGHGLMDLTAYDAYFSGKLKDLELPDDDFNLNIASMKDFPRPPDFS
jgi:tryptophan synthase beta chain